MNEAYTPTPEDEEEEEAPYCDCCDCNLLPVETYTISWDKKTARYCIVCATSGVSVLSRDRDITVSRPIKVLGAIGHVLYAKLLDIERKLDALEGKAPK